jgi:hypothetical protein
MKKISSYFSSSVPRPPKEKLDDNASQAHNTENPLVYSGKKCNKIDAAVTGLEPLCSSNITTDINDWLSFWTID